MKLSVHDESQVTFRKQSDGPADRLSRLAIKVVREACGDVKAGIPKLSEAIHAANDIGMERELYRQWESMALKHAVVAALRYLRSKGEFKLPEPATLKPLSHSLPRPTPSVAPSDSAIATISKVAGRALLKTFLVNGQPIGDLSPREIRPAIAAKHRDARFMELLIWGVPDDVAVGNLKTDADAEAAYSMAENMGSRFTA